MIIIRVLENVAKPQGDIILFFGFLILPPPSSIFFTGDIMPCSVIVRGSTSVSGGLEYPSVTYHSVACSV